MLKIVPYVKENGEFRKLSVSECGIHSLHVQYDFRTKSFRDHLAFTESLLEPDAEYKVSFHFMDRGIDSFLFEVPATRSKGNLGLDLLNPRFFSSRGSFDKVFDFEFFDSQGLLPDISILNFKLDLQFYKNTNKFSNVSYESTGNNMCILGLEIQNKENGEKHADINELRVSLFHPFTHTLIQKFRFKNVYTWTLCEDFTCHTFSFFNTCK